MPQTNDLSALSDDELRETSQRIREIQNERSNRAFNEMREQQREDETNRQREQRRLMYSV